ncbi:PIN domain-like protein, partial [Mycena latifolia]
AAKECSLLNLSTRRGFNTNNRELRTFVVGDDIRQGSTNLFLHRTCLRARGGNENAALETLFYQFCNLQEAPVTIVAVFDGSGRPAVKRGVRRVRDNPPWLMTRVKELLTAFGHYFYTAPGEAEAELAQLNKLGFIDAVITQDSDAIIFGALCVVRTSEPYVKRNSQIYTSEAISSHPLSLDEDALLLVALLVGGDYDRGLSKCGPKIAHALARCGFGRDLRRILTSFVGAQQAQQLTTWRAALKAELISNSSGLLDTRQPKLADKITDCFPNLSVADLYIDPLTSWSSRYTGHSPDTSLWIPAEPIVHKVAAFCVTHFGWSQEVIPDRLKSNLWPGVALRMIFSVRFRVHLCYPR